jgi:hypothetical protein
VCKHLSTTTTYLGLNINIETILIQNLIESITNPWGTKSIYVKKIENHSFNIFNP